MLLIINSESKIFKEPELTVAQLAEMRGISTQGTAIALNNRLVRHQQWASTILKDGDEITIITAAYGG